MNMYTMLFVPFNTCSTCTCAYRLNVVWAVSTSRNMYTCVVCRMKYLLNTPDVLTGFGCCLDRACLTGHVDYANCSSSSFSHTSMYARRLRLPMLNRGRPRLWKSARSLKSFRPKWNTRRKRCDVLWRLWNDAVLSGIQRWNFPRY